jgi:hypothetical protein
MKQPVGVPIHLIVNANPGWVRDDVRRTDVADLYRSIREHGLQHPILLDPTYQVIDGGRRVQAFVNLGLTEIPAISTNKWTVLRDRMTAERATDNVWPHMSLTWREAMRFYDMCSPIYGRSLRAKEKGMTPSRRLTVGPGTGYSALSRDISAMIGMNPSHLVSVQQMATQIKYVQEQFPEQMPIVNKLLEQVHGDGRGQIHKTTREISALRFLASDLEPNLKRAQEQKKIISAGIEMMRTVASQMAELGELNPALLAEEVSAMHNALIRVISEISPVRRRLTNRYQADKHLAREKEGTNHG